MAADPRLRRVRVAGNLYIACVAVSGLFLSVDAMLGVVGGLGLVYLLWGRWEVNRG